MKTGWAEEAARKYNEIKSSLPNKVNLVCVTKTVPLERIIEFYEITGHLIFGENYVQYQIL
jgi:uncharacterized pyridoxal phosphate-containing UPF0001 family protein